MEYKELNANQKKLVSMLGLAKKAGKLLSGTDKVICGLRSREVLYVLLASDISENTRRRLNNSCSYYKTEYGETGFNMDTLSHFVGQMSQTSAVAITNRSFADAIKKIIENTETADILVKANISEVTICHK